MTAWLDTEAALAQAQAKHGVITDEDAKAITEAAVLENMDRERLWADAKNVGYPILGLVRQISEHLPEGPNGRVHYGATTQDIMDTALALQMTRSLDKIDAQLRRLGDALAERAEEHKDSVMPGRTHAQQAIPTTFGATLATLLEQVRRQRERLAQARERVAVISLYGAGGNNAAQGETAPAVRHDMAEILGLRDPQISWHVERDVLADFGWICATVCGTVAKFGRNIVDLSRTEVAEVFEPYNSHRGASSTMPQKVNPISSELMIGISTVAGALASALPRIQESGHERAAGEWQGEWFLIPTLGNLAGAAVDEAVVVAEGMRVDTERMRANLDLDGGLIMAEAQMIQLAPALGREKAHDLVYEACTKARETHTHFQEELPVIAREHGKEDLLPDEFVKPEHYVGEAAQMVEEAVARWRGMDA
ncbi:3-carboxy-cis,cis-muconate cycloisomerase [Corynebacterium frankenforstense DSM 45800]|uniref:3-carboxy-cis,cis-muconate cycloisomerase n=1 Tax=Corynebacterium frankenforstense DSM 45800 TaxID=1437875 RepID=A0A1L7CUQ4_9CORY|nr:3-carboxy-cis,cis-muconate cycloisomerase [Corynebacterium frankenforstense DSM 45800]